MQSKHSAAIAALIDLAETAALGNTNADDLQRMAQSALQILREESDAEHKDISFAGNDGNSDAADATTAASVQRPRG